MEALIRNGLRLLIKRATKKCKQQVKCAEGGRPSFRLMHPIPPGMKTRDCCDECRTESFTRFNLFHANSLFLYPLEISENLWISDALRGYRKINA